MSKPKSADEATKIGTIAEKIVHDYLVENGWQVTPRRDVAEEKGNKGFDFYAKKGNEVRKIEVKGTKYEFSIPDMSSSEVIDIEKGIFAATHLYIVGNLRRGERPIISILDTKIIKDKVERGEIVLVKKEIVKGYSLNKLGPESEKIIWKKNFDEYLKSGFYVI
ncbi:MAG: hypothetical protein QW279_00705 [Candidatus Jordarchaeaceae archaeon]